MATIVNVQDLRPILKSIKNLNDEDPALGWQLRKEQLRNEFNDATKSSQASELTPTNSTHNIAESISSWAGGLVSALFGRGLKTGPGEPQNSSSSSNVASKHTSSGASNSNLIDLIEKIAREEFTVYAKEREESMRQMEEMKRKHIEEQLKMIKDMKDKNMKLADYISGGAAVPPPTPNAA